MTLKRATTMITGGTGALGRAVVLRLASAGETIHVPWVAEREMEDVRESLGDALRTVQFHRCDVMSEADLDSLFKAIAGRGEYVRTLANLVGGFAMAPVESTDRATWDRMLHLNATSAFACIRAAVPGMKGAREGRIINVSSAPALNHGAEHLGAYSAAKAAVLNLSESLAKELAPWGITVNAIVPSVIDTPANRQASPADDRSTWLQPAEIADVVAFLASGGGRIVTGTAVNLARGKPAPL